MAQTKNVEVKVQRNSGFDKSHKVLTTVECGTITPLLTDELMPGSTVDLRLDLAAQLPPLASDTYARMAVKAEAFFVPHRLVYGGYQNFITGQKMSELFYDEESEDYEYRDSDVVLPRLSFLSSYGLTPGNLLDQMNCHIHPATGHPVYVNALPVLAYHKVWDDWYRNSLVQKPCFVHSYNSNDSVPTATIDSIPWNSFPTGTNKDINQGVTFSNTHPILMMHQRNFESDYFTNATPNAQEGEARKVSISDGAFTIESLRLANSLQKYEERNNLAGTQYVDYIKAQYGVDVPDIVAQRSILIGSAKFTVYNKGIYTTAGNEPLNQDELEANPFIGAVGGKVGSAYAEGSDFIINNFKVLEPGTLLVLVTLCPEGTSYWSASNPMWFRYNTCSIADRMDLANPMLQGVGNQPIYKRELRPSISSGDDNSVFGYTERYADWKTMTDSVRGQFRAGSEFSFPLGSDKQFLSSFVLQRGFGSSTSPEISSEFLEIPTSYMNGITIASDTVSKFGAWIDSYLDYKVSMPLAQYCQPTLENTDEEHQMDVTVSRNGTKLN